MRLCKNQIDIPHLNYISFKLDHGSNVLIGHWKTKLHLFEVVGVLKIASAAKTLGDGVIFQN